MNGIMVRQRIIEKQNRKMIEAKEVVGEEEKIMDK